MIQMYNNNILIRPLHEKVTLENGVSYEQQRSKKDLIWGEIINPAEEGKRKVLYPLYAGNEVTIDNTLYHAIKVDDLILSKD